MLSDSAKVFERKVWRVQVAHLHNAARALSSPSRCFQLTNNLDKISFVIFDVVIKKKKQIECGLPWHWWNSTDLGLIDMFLFNLNAEIVACMLSENRATSKIWKKIFSLPRVVPWFPLLGLTPSGLFMGLSSTIIYTSELIIDREWFSVLLFSQCYAAQHSYVPIPILLISVTANTYFWCCCPFFASDLMHNSTGYVIKQLVHAFSCALSSYGALGKFGERSRS